MRRIVSMLSFLVFLYTATGNEIYQKSVSIRVTGKGDITIDGVSVYIDNLAKEVQQRLWRSYMSNGKMVSSINLVMENDLSAESRGNILHAVQTAQEKTLTVLSLHKHKKRFEDISKNKQDKIRKQFPVLFQKNYMPVLPD